MEQSVKIDPLKLPGPWEDGFVLERQHTLSSEFLGYDGLGNPQFHTVRSELGELVFQLKNRADQNAVASIAATAVKFIVNWNPVFDLIVPVPPSRKRVTYQPVEEIAKAIGARLAKPVMIDAVKKATNTPELKNVFDYQERMKLLNGAFEIDDDAVHNRRILLVDDLYRSGATVTVVTKAILAGGAAVVYLLAMTKTRTRT